MEDEWNMQELRETTERASEQGKYIQINPDILIRVLDALDLAIGGLCYISEGSGDVAMWAGDMAVSATVALGADEETAREAVNLSAQINNGRKN